MLGQMRVEKEKVLFEAPGGAQGKLTLVQTDAELCIRRGGRLVAGCFWRVGELSKAIQEFRSLGRRLREGRGV
jgi:hypothetical protein